MKRTILIMAAILTVGIAGGAYASGTITGRSIKDGSLTGKDVRNHSLTRKDFKGSVRGARGARGPQGPQGAQGAAGPGLSGVSRTEASANVAPGDVSHATVNCPAGQHLISGGFVSIGADAEVFYSDSFGSATSWSAGLDNFDSSVDATVTAVVFCVAGAPAATATRAHVRGPFQSSADIADDAQARSHTGLVR